MEAFFAVILNEAAEVRDLRGAIFVARFVAERFLY